MYISTSHDSRELVAMSALLHDIGKFFQRTDIHHDNKYADLTKNDFGENGAHSKWSASFANTLGLPKEVEQLTLYHHNPSAMLKEYRDLCKMIQEADHLSSAERIKSEERRDVKKEPIISIFSTLYREEKERENRYYYSVEPLVPLNPQMPKRTKATAFEGWKMSPDYKELWKSFEGECVKCKNHLSVDNLLYLLEKYTTYMPSAAYVSEPDVSLYDHLKTTCAIAVALHNFKKEGPRKTKNKWLFVGGSLSGIQKYIYNIKSSKHALKLLRGRSFSLELIIECIINNLLSSLGLYRANVIFSGGGNFYILCQNTPAAIETVESVRTTTNKELLERYGNTLYAVMDHVEINEDDFNEYTEVWKKLHNKLNRGKGKKYLEEINEDKRKILGPFDDVPDEEKCALCAKNTSFSISPDEEPICQECNEMLELGRKVVNNGGFILRPGGEKAFFGHEIDFFKNSPQAINDENSILYLFNEFKNVEINNTHVLYPCGKYYASGHEGLKTTDVLAHEAVGTNRIATVRMDVDHLGHIFTESIRPASLSRMATLSRFLKYFFGSYLNSIALGAYDSDKDALNIAIVYSGGDDIFYVGSWDDCLSYMFDINELFNRYTCDNITLSAGIVQSKEKYPIFKSADEAGNAEQRSKDAGRDAVTLFDSTFPWEVAKQLKERYLDRLLSISKYEEDSNKYSCILSHGAIFSLFELSKQYEKKNHLILTPLVYLSARQREMMQKKNVSDNDLRNVNEIFEHIISNPQDIRHIKMPLAWMMAYMKEGSL